MNSPVTTGRRLPENSHRRPDARRYRKKPGTPLGPPADRLRSAGWFLGAAAALVMICLLTAALDGLRGAAPRPDEAAALHRTIGLSELALVPAGQIARRMEDLPVSADGRYLPTLPRGNPGIVPLMDAARLAAPAPEMATP